MDIKQFRNRNIALLLYNEWDDFEEKLSLITKYNYAFIVHQPEEDNKKMHTHVFLKFKNARYNTSLAKEFNVEIRFIQPIRSERDFVRYLIHKDNPEKIQYEITDITSNMLEKISKHFIDIKSDFEIEIIIKYITESNVLLNKNDIVQLCIKYNMLGDLRAYWWIIKELLDEHNWKIGNSYD